MAWEARFLLMLIIVFLTSGFMFFMRQVLFPECQQ